MTVHILVIIKVDAYFDTRDILFKPAGVNYSRHWCNENMISSYLLQSITLLQSSLHNWPLTVAG